MAYSISPSGSIHLCNVPLENDYINTINFSSHEEQQNYFSSKVIYSFDNYLYTKKDNTIVVDKNYDDLLLCNYVYYRNIGYGGSLEKTYYAFITKKEYVNENTTRLTIETDVLETWGIELQWKPCYVSREHTNDDTYGANTIDENIDTGDYVANAYIIDYKTMFKENLLYIIGSTKGINISGDTITFTDIGGSMYEGVPSGYTYFMFKYESEVLPKVYLEASKQGISEAITPPFVMSKLYLNIGNFNEGDELPRTERNSNLYTIEFKLPPNTLNGYTPKNNKMLMYPYRYFVIYNNGGSSSIYRYEYLNKEEYKNGTFNFDIFTSLQPGGSSIGVPSEYMNIPRDTSKSLSIAKYPIGSYANNIYYNWLMQQSWNRTSNLFYSIGKSSLGVINSGFDLLRGYSPNTGISNTTWSGASNIISNFIDLGKTIYDDYGDVKEHQLVPYEVEGQATNISGVWDSDVGLSPILYGYTIKSDKAKSIDDYFSMYGYRTNRLKKPNITGRKSWNYVKTIGCNVECQEAPTEDIDKIRSIFDKGITIWHTTDVGNYNLDNSIV